MATDKKVKDLTAKAKKQVEKADALAALKILQVRYPHVQSITKWGVRENPTRVEIKCTTEGCSEVREIATQDAFQVKRCPTHQREFVKARRRKTPMEVVAPTKKAKKAAPKRRGSRRMKTRQTRLKSAASA